MKLILNSVLFLGLTSCAHTVEYFPGTVVKINHPDSCAETGVVLGYFDNGLYLIEVECRHTSYQLWLNKSVLSIPE